jgi:hypothetical protein
MAEPIPDRPEETQQQRAQRAIEAIFSGADLNAEAMQLANEFTDRQTARLSAWVRGGSRRPRS